MSDKTPGLVLSGEPRAQLLPPTVKEREKNRAGRRIMGMLVVLAVVLAGGGVGFAFLSQAAAQSALAEAEQRTSALIAEQAQYSDAARLAGIVSATEQAQQTVTATEIQWTSLLVAISGYAPEGAAITGVSFLAPPPWEPVLAPEGPLRTPRVAVVKLQFWSSNYGDVAAFVQRIPSLHGFGDVAIDATIFEDGVYKTDVTLTLDAEAVSKRFAPVSDAGDTDSDDDGSDQ